MIFKKYLKRIKMLFNKEKIVKFVDKQSFYIVLFICISIIGVTALLTSKKEIYPHSGIGQDIPPMEEIADNELSSDSKNGKHDIEDIDIKIKDAAVDNADNNGDKDQENIQASEHFNSESAEYTDTKHSEPKQTSSDAIDEIIQEDNEVLNKQNNSIEVNPVISQQKSHKIMMIHPVEGEVIREYSMDELIYSTTLKEWTTHSGMDIESFLGAEVKAAMDGIVEKIEEDPLMGIMITLDHGNGIKTRYANLSTANMVEENQAVKAGQVISGVGKTAGAEILDPPHLHFELIIDDEYVNPAEYLK